ncbi:MAG: YdeI/OmpD-associated family protein [Rectinemataceae bacterium]
MDKEVFSFPSALEFETWLEENFNRERGIWMAMSKKGSTGTIVSYVEALDSALCFGWIDGQKGKGDGQTWLQYFCRRKPNSVWSQTNKESVERLIREGRMRQPGHKAIEEAKLSGAWDSAYQPIRSREIPPELATALDGNKKAKEFFETLSSQNRFAFVFRIQTAKKKETRERKAAEFVRMMERGEVFHPLKRTGDA